MAVGHFDICQRPEIPPRSITLTGEDYSGATTNYYLTFGPQVTNGWVVRLDDQRYQFTNVAHLGTNLLADLSNLTLTFPSRIRYKLEIIGADGQLINGVGWEEVNEQTLTDNLTLRVFDAFGKNSLPLHASSAMCERPRAETARIQSTGA